jgi:hypothetical protein
MNLQAVDEIGRGVPEHGKGARQELSPVFGAVYFGPRRFPPVCAAAALDAAAPFRNVQRVAEYPSFDTAALAAVVTVEANIFLTLLEHHPPSRGWA